MSTLKSDRTFKEPIIWSTTLFMLMFHVLAVAAFFFFTWKALAVAVLLWWVAGSLGIGMSYHRLLTHRGYKTTKWMEYFLTTCGTLALEGGPIAWVATHRKHHNQQQEESQRADLRDGAEEEGRGKYRRVRQDEQLNQREPLSHRWQHLRCAKPIPCDERSGSE